MKKTPKKEPDAMLFPYRWFDTLFALPDEELREMLGAIRAYRRDGAAPDFSGLKAALWNEFRQRLDCDADKYRAMCDRNRENGRNGGRPPKKKNPEKPGKPGGFRENPKKPEKPDADAEADADADAEGSLSEKSKRKNPDRPASVLPFAEFWEIFGKKIDRDKCLRCYAAVSEEERAVIREKLPAYVAATPDLQFRKNPLSWLRGRCWLDEDVPTAPLRAGGRASPPPTGPRWSDHETGENVDVENLF